MLYTTYEYPEFVPTVTIEWEELEGISTGDLPESSPPRSCFSFSEWLTWTVPISTAFRPDAPINFY